MKLLNQKAKSLIIQFKKVEYRSVLREKNALADELANQAMDAQFPLYDMSPITSQTTLW